MDTIVEKLTLMHLLLILVLLRNLEILEENFFQYCKYLQEYWSSIMEFKLGE